MIVEIHPLKEKRENKRRPKGRVSNHILASWGSIKVHMATFSILLLEESKGWTIQNEWQSWVEHLKVYDERGSEQPLSFAIDLANLIWSKWQNMRFFYYTKKTQRVPKKTWEGQETKFIYHLLLHQLWIFMPNKIIITMLWLLTMCWDSPSSEHSK